MNRALLAACVGATTTAASAQLRTYTGPGGPINDLSVNRFTIFVPDHGPCDVDNIAADMFHTSVGDLIVSVRHTAPADYSVLLINRPNGDTFGNNNDLNGVYTFRDGFDPIPISNGGNTVIPPGTYGPVSGQTITRTIPDIYGEWVLTVEDAAGADTGHVDWWSISFADIPTPGTLVPMCVASTFIVRRRRR